MMVSVPAHFDGRHIQLDEPLHLEPDMKLIVTVLATGDGDRYQWSETSQMGLNCAYGEDEPDYSLTPLVSPNPDYARE